MTPEIKVVRRWFRAEEILFLHQDSGLILDRAERLSNGVWEYYRSFQEPVRFVRMSDAIKFVSQLVSQHFTKEKVN